MEIDIKLFEKNFEVTKNGNTKYTLKNKQSLYCKILPFTRSSRSEYVIINLHYVVGAYIRNICSIDSIKLSKSNIIENLCMNIDYDEKNEAFLVEIIDEIFFDENDNIVPLNISLYKYSSSSSSENKIAKFISDTMGNKEEILRLISNIDKNYNYNTLENLFIKNLGDTTKKTYLKEYETISLNLQDMFLKDITFVLSNTDLAKTYMSNLLELYYFNYIAQTSVVLSRFFSANPYENIKLYYGLDWETMSKNRFASKSWRFLSKEIRKLLSHSILLEILNQNTNGVFSSYGSIALELKNDISKDEEYAKQISKISTIYKKSLHNYKEHVNKLQKLDNCSTKTEIELRHLFDCIYLQFQHTPQKRMNESYYKQFLDFCKNKKLKQRGNIGFVLNITHNDLIFLTKLAIGKNEMKRLSDVFLEFEKRGVSFDKKSKDMIISYYEKLNIIEKKSDSGDALYVKRIL